MTFSISNTNVLAKAWGSSCYQLWPTVTLTVTCQVFEKFMSCVRKKVLTYCIPN